MPRYNTRGDLLVGMQGDIWINTTSIGTGRAYGGQWLTDDEVIYQLDDPDEAKRKLVIYDRRTGVHRDAEAQPKGANEIRAGAGRWGAYLVRPDRGVRFSSGVRRPGERIHSVATDGTVLLSDLENSWLKVVEIDTGREVRVIPTGTIFGATHLSADEVVWQTADRVTRHLTRGALRAVVPGAVSHLWTWRGALWVCWQSQADAAFAFPWEDSSVGFRFGLVDRAYGAAAVGRGDEARLASSTTAGERLEDVTEVRVTFSHVGRLGPTSPAPRPAPEPTPEPAPSPVPSPPEVLPMRLPDDVYAALVRERSKYPSSSPGAPPAPGSPTNDQCVEILNAVAWQFAGWALLSKPGGNHGVRRDGVPCSVDILVAPGGAGFDVFTDAGGRTEPSQSDSAETFESSRLVAPIAPVDAPPAPSPVPAPAPVPTPAPSSELLEAVRALGAAVDKLRDEVGVVRSEQLAHAGAVVSALAALDEQLDRAYTGQVRLFGVAGSVRLAPEGQ